MDKNKILEYLKSEHGKDNVTIFLMVTTLILVLFLV